MKKQILKYYTPSAVSLLPFAVYLFSLHKDFGNWDDDVYVFQSPHVLSLDLSFLKWAFSAFYAYNWHPLTWVSHALDYAVWGLDPFGHHLTSIALHAINAFLVVFLVIRLPEDFNKAIELNGEYAAAYYNRGTFYRNTRRKELAVADFRRALFRS